MALGGRLSRVVISMGRKKNILSVSTIFRPDVRHCLSFVFNYHNIFDSLLIISTDVGPNFRKEIESRMTSREKSLLDEHNKRRKDYHVNKYGVSYVPLKWSEELKYLSLRR